MTHRIDVIELEDIAERFAHSLLLAVTCGSSTSLAFPGVDCRYREELFVLEQGVDAGVRRRVPVDEKPTRVTLHHVQDCPDCACAGAQFNEIPNFEACHYKVLRIAAAAMGTPEISAGARTPARSFAAG